MPTHATYRWDQVCPGCSRRLPFRWRIPPFGPGRHLLLRRFGGPRQIRVEDSLDYLDPGAEQFRFAWIGRLRASLEYLLRASLNGRWAVSTSAFIPKVVERYSRSSFPEPRTSDTRKWAP